MQCHSITTVACLHALHSAGITDAGPQHGTVQESHGSQFCNRFSYTCCRFGHCTACTLGNALIVRRLTCCYNMARQLYTHRLVSLSADVRPLSDHIHTLSKGPSLALPQGAPLVALLCLVQTWCKGAVCIVLGVAVTIWPQGTGMCHQHCCSCC